MTEPEGRPGRSESVVDAGRADGFRIAASTADTAIDWPAVDRSFVVEHELRLQLVDGVLGYEELAVGPYVKSYAAEPALQPELESVAGPEADADGIRFVARAGDRIAAEIVVARAWNGYASIEDLVVATAFRRRGLARALVERAIEWSVEQRLPGVRLETQHNNVAACRLYAACGFALQGFDASLYRGLDRDSREIALFWYRPNRALTMP